MCGIIGYVGKNNNAINVIFKGLKKLEYRGYDSAGLAVIANKKFKIIKSVGKLYNLDVILKKNFINANIGIGHTRWATHGKPSKENAHPHTDFTESIVIVHNGIIENYIELKTKFMKKAPKFKSETDTEIIAHLLKKNYKNNLLHTVQKILTMIKGSYALGIMCTEEPDKIVCAKQDASLIIGLGKGENFIASDIPALLPYTRNMIFLENGDIAEITAEKVIIKDIKNNVKIREIKNIQWDTMQSEKNGYKHFMLKEIFEQPHTIEETFRDRIYINEGKIHIKEIKFDEKYVENISNICVVGCGTAYHAGLISKFLFENFAKIPTEVDIASEFRYRGPILNKKKLVIVISQSGETADTLAALRLAKSEGCETIAICNVIDSSISRESTNVIYTQCGPEIGVASTKAFTSQLSIIYMLALDWGYKRKKLTNEELKKYLKELWEIPSKIFQFLKKSKDVRNVAKVFVKKMNKNKILYLGRHINYPIALEGALKLKELSYIHAEGYAAGEMKHGPIALIDKSMFVVAIAMKSSRVYTKMVSNIEEVKARGGIAVIIAERDDREIASKSKYIIYIPQTGEFISPIMTVVSLQLLAYYTSVFLGYDVDQPRNLAKSVTVE
ncbi:MAG: glutamine--fructose-6-phosphate transaminase (isomerizing) [Endomicrobium sp.]|jgi:glucosamine--fructose-6-phosphate aminotransferase (isomerizing)|nr:glutamine--fructose-6-phosphate transaminase (isomerizing) [Endomicrobium sp.]